jgi:hypothetical protein
MAQTNTSANIPRTPITVAIVLAVIALIAAALYWQKFGGNSAPRPFAVEKTQLSSDSIPKGFPADLPTESGAQVLENHEATTTDGRLQSTRKIITTKSLTAAAEEYQRFFEKHGWKVIPTDSASEQSVTVLMRKENDTLTIVAMESSQTNRRTVELALTEYLLPAN